MLISRPILRAAKPPQALGQLGGHVKRGVAIPHGERTGKPMALVSALPLEPDSDRLVLAFMDRSDPVETFDYRAASGDNAVLVAPRADVHLSLIQGVCLGDWRGVKVELGEPIEEPVELNVDPTGLDVEASDAWVDMVDELGCDCSKLGGHPLWANAPMDIDAAVGRPQRFHHRLSSDVLDFKLGGDAGSLCWQEAGGGSEQTYHHYQ